MHKTKMNKSLQLSFNVTIARCSIVIANKKVVRRSSKDSFYNQGGPTHAKEQMMT